MNEQSKTPAEQAREFLALSGEFRLGDLTTESSHPRTTELSQVAERSIVDALGLLFDVDADIVDAYRRWIGTGAPGRIAEEVARALRGGGRIFLTGCGATGRLSILLDEIWREYWADKDPSMAERTRSVMAGGDYALIKSVEGFEDFTQFGEKQIEEMGVSEGDVVFAITEGGETSFVIGTAWQGLKVGAKVYFVYCNPDDALRSHVTRSREVLDEPRIEKVNLTTGPMAIAGSTRMQATSIQLLAMLTVLDETADETADRRLQTAAVRVRMLDGVEQVWSVLSSSELREQIARVVGMEEAAYRGGGRSTYFADRLGIDVLTDTTERSPTFCTPAFRKWDDGSASDSWTYLILPYADSKTAWERLLRRPPYGLAWDDVEILRLVGPERVERQSRIMAQIGPEEILRFRIGLDGLEHRPVRAGDIAVCVATESEADSVLSPGGFFRTQIENAHAAGASTALIFIGREESLDAVRNGVASWGIGCAIVLVPVPDTDLLLRGIERIAAKMLLNALSTCVMVRLGRVLGNCMVAVVPSNLKLIDRSIRYIGALTGLSYDDACHRLFESIEHVKSRMQSGQAYPPPVELTVKRVRRGCTLPDAEEEMRGPA